MTSTFVQTLQALRSPSEAVRERAMIALGGSGDARAAGFLELALASESNGSVLARGQQVLRSFKNRIRAATPSDALTAAGGRPTFSIEGLEAFLQRDPLPPRGELIRLMATLCTLRSPRLYEPLKGVLARTHDLDVTRTALVALGTACQGRAISLLVRHLSHETPEVRCAACDGLFLTGEIIAYPYFVGTLSDVALPVRRRSLLYLQWLGRENLHALLRSMTASTRPWKREAAARGMGLFRHGALVALLEPLLDDGEERVRRAALGSLVAHARRGDDEARECLARQARREGGDGTPLVEDMPAETLVGAPMEHDALPWEDLDAPDSATRMEAVEEIARSQDETGALRLLERVEIERDERVLSFLFSAMGRMHDRRFLSCLRHGATHAAPRVRANAVEALARLLDGDERRELVPFLADENNRVRATTVVALRESAGSEGLSALRDMFARKDPAWLRSAIHAVSALGSVEAVALLEPVLDGEDREAGERARSLLESLAEGGMREAGEILSRASNAGQAPSSAVDWGGFEGGAAPALHPTQSGRIDWEPRLEKMTESEVEAVLAGHGRSKIYREEDDPHPSEAERRVPSLVADGEGYEELPSSPEGVHLASVGPSTRIVAPKVRSPEAVRRATRPVDVSTLGDEAAPPTVQPASPSEGRHCPRCGEIDGADARSCRFCGSPFSEDEGEAPVEADETDAMRMRPQEPEAPGPTRRVDRSGDGGDREHLVDRRDRQRRARLDRPGVVVALLLVDLVVGVLAVVAGLWMCMNREIPLSEAFLTILYGGACFFVGIQLFFGARWVRWVQGFLLLPPVARTLVFAPFALLVLVLSFLPSTSDWCRR